MQTQRITADINALNGGAVARAINEALLVAGQRLRQGSTGQTLAVEIKLAPSDLNPAEIIKVTHKVQVKDAAPKPEASFAFITPQGALEVDQTIDHGDPALSQKVLPMDRSKEAAGA